MVVEHDLARTGASAGTAGPLPCGPRACWLSTHFLLPTTSLLLVGRTGEPKVSASMSSVAVA